MSVFHTLLMGEYIEGLKAVSESADIPSTFSRLLGTNDRIHL